MFEVALDSSSGIKVEVCRICEFVWFDAGETQTLQARPLPKPKPQVVLPQKVREIIAIERDVKQLAEQARGPDFDSVAPDERWKWIAAFLGMPVEFDAAPQEQRPWAVFRDLSSPPVFWVCVHTAARNRVAILGLIPAQATRLHGLTLPHIVFPSCRGNSSHRQHVPPSRVRR